jgi:hypothetical protein
MDDARRISVYPHAPLEIASPAEEPPAVAHDEPAAYQQERWTRPLAAANPMELVARWEMADQLPRALALYDALRQLHVSTTPEGEAASLWLADPQAAIVTQTWEQAAAVHKAIAEQAPGAGAPDPVVLIADPAYQSRRDAERSGEAALAPERAYVVATLDDGDGLTRAVSVAMESHLVTRPPDQLTVDLQVVHAREIAKALHGAEADAGGHVTPGRSIELALEAGLRQTEADREAGRQAGGLEATPGGGRS